ncbi:hypothetical protein [Shinella sp. CPCC 101442]|uniref:hypothetical protein n=1 Tax=Shinella sp. CPCC 101442 TaxID=2932265 RepID=UPI0027E52AD4|nr:hypothetical protein [Shinella sp. CPCC 101442]
MRNGRQHQTGPTLEPLRRLIRGRLATLPPGLSEFILFGLKQAWACLFGGLMLGLSSSRSFSGSRTGRSTAMTRCS